MPAEKSFPISSKSIFYKAHSLSSFVLACLLALTLTGCTIATGAAVLGTSYVMSQERSTGKAIDDNIIYAKLNEQYIRTDLEIFNSISITVFESRVMLTGSVQKKEHMLEAVRIAKSTPGVREVINELEISSKSIADTASDTFISNQVRVKLLAKEHVRSNNFYITTNKSIVYILGVARSNQELDIVIEIASRIKGVKKVVSHIVLKEDKRR